MYLFVKIWVRAGLRFYCAHVRFDRQNLYAGKAPLILACSHPNSFFDALVMGAYHPRKLYFLARGDAFSNPVAARVLRMLNMIPIYRISEGKENLDNNQHTFDQCIDILRDNGAILIFSEGISINEWKLRPLKKGTARLAHMCWQEQGIEDMMVQPVGINYHSFEKVPKRVQVNSAPLIKKGLFDLSNAANFYNDFNAVLKDRLLPLVLEKNAPTLQKRSNPLLKAMVVVPALIGFVIHKPFYSGWKKFVQRKTKGTVFYDSVLFAGMLILYPILVVLVTLVVVLCTGNPLFWLLLFGLPFTAWSYKTFKSY